MKRTRMLAAAAAAVSFAFALTACAAPGTPVIAPVTVEVGDLQGDTVELVVGQVLNINTGSLDVGSYEAEIADPSIAEFVQGRDDGYTKFNPGFTAKKAGETDITLTNEQGGIQPVEFTLKVTE